MVTGRPRKRDKNADCAELTIYWIDNTPYLVTRIFNRTFYSFLWDVSELLF